MTTQKNANFQNCNKKGDAESWKVEGFCKSHKGQITENKKKSNLTKDELRNAEKLIDEIVDLLTNAFSGSQNVFILPNLEIDSENDFNENFEFCQNRIEKFLKN
ncbi:hypothetical protein MHBO_003425 [Bonamia ostreae]|uniref:Uncharacterized protein n=1 Tax=Bonamia ostreae TaxID=126728 RepID=A0ABV2AQF3_9EUKA